MIKLDGRLIMRVIALKYTEAHEWVSFDSDTSIGTMGITDYAQNSLGDVVFVELPQKGEKVEQKGQSSTTILR